MPDSIKDLAYWEEQRIKQHRKRYGGASYVLSDDVEDKEEQTNDDE